MLSYVQISRNDDLGKVIIKSTNKIRTNYLSKLAYEKMWLSP